MSWVECIITITIITITITISRHHLVQVTQIQHILQKELALRPFLSMPDDVLRVLCKNMTCRELDCSERVCKQGEPAETFNVILQGMNDIIIIIIIIIIIM